MVTKTYMSKRCSVPHQIKPHKAGEQFQRKRMGEHYMLSKMFLDYSHFPQHHFLHSLAVNFSVQSPRTLWTASNMVLILFSSNLRIHKYFCAMQSFSCSLNILVFTLCSCYLPDAECPMRVVTITKDRQ